MTIAFTTILPLEGFRRLEARPELALKGKMLMVGEKGSEDAEILVCTFDYRVPRTLIEAMPRLRLIANFGAGFNNIDLEACRERGIRVTNTPQPVVEPTAELAFALMIDVARRVSEFDRAIRNGTGEPMAVMNNLSHSLYGKTLGILGMGRIGQALARRAVASGMRIIYHNRKELRVESLTLRETESEKWKADIIRSARFVDFQTLLQESDYLSLNLPYTPEVHHIISKPELGMMKRTAFLINTARGAHVDEKALIEALRSGIIAGAALDVYEHEPQISEELLTLPNVVLSPHTGTGTWEGRIAMCENVTDNIIAFIDNQPNKMNIVI
jgi:glyoxylate reductase